MMEMDEKIHQWLFELGVHCLADEPVAAASGSQDPVQEHGHDWPVTWLKISQFLCFVVW